VEGDARGWRVALVAGELLNGANSVDVLGVLERNGWGAIQLPAAEYPDAVAGPLLEQVAEQTGEFEKHRYQLVVLGQRDGLTEALAAYGIGGLPQHDPTDEAGLEAFLAPFPAAQQPA
jgi:hypothetical protein